MPVSNDQCETCGHAYEFHATDLHNTRERCWYGSVIGESCALECHDWKHGRSR